MKIFNHHKNKKILILLIVLFLIFFILMTIKKNEKKLICFNENCFKVIIADNNIERSRGLMFIDNLDKKEGMFFVYETEGIHYFWMKNTNIPLDIIWMDKNFKVVLISHKTPTCKKNPCTVYGNDNITSSYVLEIGEGIANNIGLKLGDKFVLKK